MVMPIYYDTLSGKQLDSVEFVETDAGRQHLANGSYDSVPYSLYDVKWTDGTKSQDIEVTEVNGQFQRTLAVLPNGVMVSGKLNHPGIP